MFCETCGQKLIEGAKFCGACGSKQSDGDLQSQSTVSTQVMAESIPKLVAEPLVQSVSQPVQPPVQQPVRPAVQPSSQPIQRPVQPQYQTPPPPQQQFTAPPFQTAAILSVWDYLKMMLLLCIPLVNIVFMLLWAFNSSENPNKRNYALASLLFLVIMTVVGFVFSILLGGLFAAMIMEMGGSY